MQRWREKKVNSEIGIAGHELASRAIQEQEQERKHHAGGRAGLLGCCSTNGTQNRVTLRDPVSLAGCLAARQTQLSAATVASW